MTGDTLQLQYSNTNNNGHDNDNHEYYQIQQQLNRIMDMSELELFIVQLT